MKLDGRTFEGVVLECGKTSGDAETITFKNGRFHSSACERYGYGDGPYKASARRKKGSPSRPRPSPAVRQAPLEGPDSRPAGSTAR